MFSLGRYTPSAGTLDESVLEQSAYNHKVTYCDVNGRNQTQKQNLNDNKTKQGITPFLKSSNDSKYVKIMSDYTVW